MTNQYAKAGDISHGVKKENPLCLIQLSIKKSF